MPAWQAVPQAVIETRSTPCSSSSSGPPSSRRHAPALQPLADRLAQGVGLLVDLLEHEGLVAALLGGGVVPVDGRLGALELAAVEVEQRDALGRDHDQLAVLDLLDAARLLEEGDDVGGEERLAVAEADHQRALQARADDHLRVQRRDDAEREVPVEVAEREAHGLDEIALVVLLEQVRDHLGVGLRAEDVAVGDQARLQLDVVLDDAVEHDREAVVAAGQGMRVGLGGAAVGRPARVPDAGRRRRVEQVRDGTQHGQVADGAHELDLMRRRPARARRSRSRGTRAARGRRAGRACSALRRRSR